MYTQRPAAFDYHRPVTLDEAIALLQASDEARPLAGGHSLLPAMKLRLSAPAALVDLGGVPGLDGIDEADGGVRIGALVTHEALAESGLVASRCPVMAEAAEQVGDPQVRHRGTVGGSVAHADPGADYPTVVKALGATITVRGPQGERQIAADDFFTSIFTTALRPAELVTSVTVPGTPAGTGAVYLKHRHPASRYAVVGVAAVVTVGEGGCTDARLTVGGATGVAVTVPGVADALRGHDASGDAIAAAVAGVAGALDGGLGDQYASAEYRVHLATVMAGRALREAFARAS